MSTLYICNRCGEVMNNIYTRFTLDYFKGDLEKGDRGFDICEKCHKEFEKFMESSTVKLRPLSEVVNPPKINGCGQCEFDSTSIDDEPCVSCGSGNSNFKPKGFYDNCEQCKFKDFSWDEEPCLTCKYSTMSVGDDQYDNFESKEEDDTDTLLKAKYKIGSYIQSSDGKGDIYKITDVIDNRSINDGEIIYRIKNLSINTYSSLTESIIDRWYTVIVKYSCEGCKLEAVDDCICDTCLVPDEKGTRRQWWKPKEEG